MVRLRNIHSVFEKDPQVGQIFSALEKKKKQHTKLSIILFMVMKKN